MKPISEKVASLGPSKALVEAGIVLDAHFSWFHDGKSPFVADTDISMDSMLGITCICPAPLPCELAELFEGVDADAMQEAHDHASADKMADGFVEMALWLKEDGHIKEADG